MQRLYNQKQNIYLGLNQKLINYRVINHIKIILI